jgi:16S rRNA (adenine1518-N6/adenine1519-N6)-dimethyltransferase
MKAKKSLGQNFLKSQQALREIIEAANLSKDDFVLEVGPGKGILTEKLLEKAGKVVAVEKDNELINFLTEKFQKEIENGQFELINADILDFSAKNHFKEQNYKIVANIPYYITGQFLRKFLSTEKQLVLMVLMLQKEVARRIVGREEESILSMSVKAYGNPKYISTVKAEYFSPKPKVDSAILLINDISNEFFKEIDENEFFEAVKAGFLHKRKKLIRNLEEIYEPAILEKAFETCRLDKNIRAENLSLGKWKELLLKIEAYPQNN